MSIGGGPRPWKEKWSWSVFRALNLERDVPSQYEHRSPAVSARSASWRASCYNAPRRSGVASGPFLPSTASTRQDEKTRRNLLGHLSQRTERRCPLRRWVRVILRTWARQKPKEVSWHGPSTLDGSPCCVRCEKAAYGTQHPPWNASISR